MIKCEAAGEKLPLSLDAWKRKENGIMLVESICKSISALKIFYVSGL